MARQVLENGVILPAEYSDDWYDDMTSNLTKLDDVIGSDSEKLSSADVGAAALSNNYNDLDNLPTIPTVNDATLTIQKNGVDVQTFTANASSNVTANITVPTKTSDITNDSNFVDTSNSAVASGITSAKVTDYDSHIADTDIHVTTADKSKWNNGVTQAFVFRYSSTALVASSTNSNTLLDNTDNLKVGDKVIDSSGVLFSITAIDTQNSTFTIGTALIDLAQDSDVVHKSGDETISGVKTITDSNLEFKSTSAEYGVSAGDSSVIFKDKNNRQTFKIYNKVFSSGLDNNLVSFFLTQKVNNTYYTSNGIQLFANTGDKNVMLRPILANNNADGLLVSLGASDRRWSKIYGTEYYYGSNNVEFSIKFVTTDTDQTISGNKTFSSNVNVYNSDSATDTANIVLKNSKAEVGTEFTEQSINFVDKNNNALAKINCYGSSGNTRLYITAYDSNNNSDGVFIRKSTIGTSILPTTPGAVAMGNSTFPYYNVQSNRFNGVEPSSLSLPSGNVSDFIDISSYFSNTGSGGTNTYTALANGWIYLRLGDITSCQVVLNDSSDRRLWGTSATGNVEQIIMPILKNTKLTTTWVTDSTVNVATARFIPCQGNV